MPPVKLALKIKKESAKDHIVRGLTAREIKNRNFMDKLKEKALVSCN